MKPRYRYLNEVQRVGLRGWWRALQPRSPESPSLPFEWSDLGRGDRAKLKRCSTVDELGQESAANRLAAHLAKDIEKLDVQRNRWVTEHYDSLLLLAGVLAHVEKDLHDKASHGGRSLAWIIGNANIAPGQDKASMSELRFKRLLRARDNEDFYRQLIRALQLAKGKADVAVLADDVLAWSIEKDKAAHAPSDSLKFRWARDYYLTAKQQTFADSTNSTATNGERAS
jgi:CRISPR system Cascade subunit CasB